MNSCYHCGNPIYHPVCFHSKSFCCQGCKTVYELFTAHGLTNYYQLEKKPGLKPTRGRYQYLKKESIVNQLLEFKETELHIILLSHNVYFHKEVSFINGRTKESSDTNYWILRKIDNISYLQDFELTNPIQNSYELLWRELKTKDHNSGVTIQNTMRRIIENYFKILGGYVDDDIINKFNNPQEKEICRSLICWINEGSHTIPDDLFVELQDNTIENYFKVFKLIFKETGHIAHYEMMMN